MENKSAVNLMWPLICIVLIFCAISILSYNNSKQSINPTEFVDYGGERFIVLNEYNQNFGDTNIHYYTTYDSVTKVMYLVGKAQGSSPTFTVMVGKNGSPLIYSK